MKIVLVLALVLGVALFQPPAAANNVNITAVECYRCGENYPYDKTCDKLTETDATKPCKSGICFTAMDSGTGKLKERGCYKEDTYYNPSPQPEKLEKANKEGKCLMKAGVSNCISPAYIDKCKEKSRKRRDDSAPEAIATDAAPTGGDATPASSGSAGEPADANKGASAAGSEGGSKPGESKERSMVGWQQQIGQLAFSCFCDGEKCNWDVKLAKKTKCYRCKGESTEGNEDKCVALDTEKSDTVECPGEYCAIWKWKYPASTDGKSAAFSGIERGCAPVSNLVYDCFKKHGEEIDKVTCAVGNEKNSVTSYGKVEKCLSEGNAEGRQSDYILKGLTADQQANGEKINCICQGELCNESGKGSHLVLSNGVIMLGLMMMIARTEKLI